LAVTNGLWAASTNIIETRKFVTFSLRPRRHRPCSGIFPLDGERPSASYPPLIFGGASMIRALFKVSVSLVGLMKP
jgi:hypothetical protein